MKVSIVKVAESRFEVRGTGLVVSTVRQRMGNSYTWLTAILCAGRASDSWSSDSKDAALIAHDRIVSFVRGWERDPSSRYAAFVTSALEDIGAEAERPITVLPPPASTAAVVVPAQPHPVCHGNVIAFVPRAARRRTDTIPAPGAA